MSEEVEETEQDLIDEMKKKYDAEVLSIEKDEQLNIHTITFYADGRKMTAKGYSRTDALHAALTWLAAAMGKQ